MSTQYGDFLHRARPNLDRSCSARFASVALIADDHYTGLLSSVVLGPAPALQRLRTPPDLSVQEVAVLNRIVDPGLVPFLLDAIGNGIVPANILGTSLPIHVGYLADPGKSSFSLSNFMEPTQARTQEHGIEYGGYECLSAVDQIRTALEWRREEDLCRMLPACEVPARDIYDLASCFHIPPGQNQYRQIAVFAPTWVRIAAVTPIPEESAIKVDVESFWKDGISTSSLVAKAKAPGGPPVRLKHPLSPRAAGDGELAGASYATASIPWQSDAGPVDLILLQNGSRVDSRSAGVPNMRLRTHKYFYSECAPLLDRLSPVSKKDRAHFEEHVASLLHVCGFSVEHFGGGRVRNEIDLVAFIDDTPVLFLECTTEVPSSDKLMHCKSRADECIKTLGLSSHRPAIAIVTPLVTIDAGDSRRANEHGVALLGRDDFEEMLSMSERSYSPWDIVQLIRQRGWYRP